jgi:ABC-type transport system involved in multi-copper enzyme maturation permease subunit
MPGPLQPEPILLRYIFNFFPVLTLVVAVPMTTMRLLSEEQRSGTLEVLLTAPVGEWSVVLSKFFAALVFFMLAWCTWAVYPVAFRYMARESFDYRPLLSFLLGMTTMSAGFLAMGLFFSSLTRNQIIAFIMAFVGMFMLTALAWFMWMKEEAGTGTSAVQSLKHIAYLQHLSDLARGQVHIQYLVFHVSCAIFWLFLTVKVLEARKWK